MKDRKILIQLIREYVDGQISPEDFLALEEALRDCEEAREIYLHEMNVHCALDDIALGDSSSLETLPLAAEKSYQQSQTFAQMPPADFSLPLMFKFAMAALIVLSVSLISYIAADQLNQPEDAAKTQTRNVAATTQQYPAAGRLLNSINANWNNQDTMLAMPGEALKVGIYELTNGSADITIGDNINLKVIAPAKFELRSQRHLFIHQGQFLARMPEQAVGFRIGTSTSEVVNLGSEVGILRNNWSTEVHIYRGLVEFLAYKDNKTKSFQLSQGQSKRVKNKGEIEHITQVLKDSFVQHNRYAELGLRFLRGRMRVLDDISKMTTKDTPGKHWIELVLEGKNITLDAPVEVQVASPGSYKSHHEVKTIPAGAVVDSYLLQFKPAKFKSQHGAMAFRRPVAGIISNSAQLKASDDLFNPSPGHIPHRGSEWRGMEPDQRHLEPEPRQQGNGLQSDVVGISRKMSTIWLKTMANLDGVDQVRILVYSQGHIPQDAIKK